MISQSPNGLWLMIITLAVSAYLLKVAGLVIVGGRQLPKHLANCLALIPAALLAALVIKDTFSIGQVLTFDARVAGIVVALVAAWKRLPLIVVVILAAVTTALIRS